MPTHLETRAKNGVPVAHWAAVEGVHRTLALLLSRTMTQARAIQESAHEWKRQRTTTQAGGKQESDTSRSGTLRRTPWVASAAALSRWKRASFSGGVERRTYCQGVRRDFISSVAVSRRKCARLEVMIHCSSGYRSGSCFFRRSRRTPLSTSTAISCAQKERHSQSARGLGSATQSG